MYKITRFMKILIDYKYTYLFKHFAILNIVVYPAEPFKTFVFLKRLKFYINFFLPIYGVPSVSLQKRKN